VSPEDAARTVRARAVPAGVAELGVGAVVVTAELTAPAAVRVRVPEEALRPRAGGGWAVDRELVVGDRVGRAVQPWHAVVEPDEEARWRAYLRPGSDRVLRNLVDADSVGVLRAEEDRQVTVAMVGLGVRPVEQSFDLAHLRAVHERLFAGVYPWAGEPRSVDMGKGVGTDAFVSWAAVETTFDHVAGQVRGHDWFRGMPREEFVSVAAWTYNAVNTIHPFREGNGRAQRVWLDDLAAGAGREFDWPRVPGGGQRRDVPACQDGGAGGDAGDARPDHRITGSPDHQPAGPGGPVNAAASRRRSRGRPRPGPRSPGSPPDRSPGRPPGRGSGTGWTGRPGIAGTSVGRSVGGPADAWSTRSPTTGWPRCTARAARGGSSSAPSARCSTPRPRQAGDRARPARGIGSGADPVDDRPNRGAAVAPSRNFPCRLVTLP